MHEETHYAYIHTHIQGLSAGLSCCCSLQQSLCLMKDACWDHCKFPQLLCNYLWHRSSRACPDALWSWIKHPSGCSWVDKSSLISITLRAVSRQSTEGKGIDSTLKKRHYDVCCVCMAAFLKSLSYDVTTCICVSALQVIYICFSNNNFCLDSQSKPPEVTHSDLTSTVIRYQTTWQNIDKNMGL